MNSEQQQQRIMGYFIEEAREHLQTIEQGVLNLQDILNDSESVNELFRAAHSIKGGAAMLGVGSIQHVSHRLEDFFKILKENPQINVDERLKSLLLAGFDPLSELLDELQVGFRISDELTTETSNRVKPVFTELESYLNQLVADTNDNVPSVAVSHHSAPQKIVEQSQSLANSLESLFQQEVTTKMRNMLQLFRGEDTVESRSELQEICNYFQEIGSKFNLRNWTHLVTQIKNAIAQPSNSFRTLAPILIRELRESQDLVLSNREAEIEVSSQLQNLLPYRFSEPEDDEVSTIFTTASEGIEEEPIEANLTISDDAIVTTENIDFVDSDLDPAVEDIDLFADQANEEEFDLAEINENQIAQMDWMDSEYDITENQHIDGPKVGASELKSLAILFENDDIDFDAAWEDIESNETNMTNHGVAATTTHGQDEFADLLDHESDNTQGGVPRLNNDGSSIDQLFGDDFLSDEPITTDEQKNDSLFPDDLDSSWNQPEIDSINFDSNLGNLVTEDFGTDHSLDNGFDLNLGIDDLGVDIVDQIDGIQIDDHIQTSNNPNINIEDISIDDLDFSESDQLEVSEQLLESGLIDALNNDRNDDNDFDSLSSEEYFAEIERQENAIANDSESEPFALTFSEEGMELLGDPFAIDENLEEVLLAPPSDTTHNENGEIISSNVNNLSEEFTSDNLGASISGSEDFDALDTANLNIFDELGFDSDEFSAVDNSHSADELGDFFSESEGSAIANADSNIDGIDIDIDNNDDDLEDFFAEANDSDLVATDIDNGLDILAGQDAQKEHPTDNTDELNDFFAESEAIETKSHDAVDLEQELGSVDNLSDFFNESSDKANLSEAIFVDAVDSDNSHDDLQDLFAESEGGVTSANDIVTESDFNDEFSSTNNLDNFFASAEDSEVISESDFNDEFSSTDNLDNFFAPAEDSEVISDDIANGLDNPTNGVDDVDDLGDFFAEVADSQSLNENITDNDWDELNTDLGIDDNEAIGTVNIADADEDAFINFESSQDISLDSFAVHNTSEENLPEKISAPVPSSDHSDLADLFSSADEDDLTVLENDFNFDVDEDEKRSLTQDDDIDSLANILDDDWQNETFQTIDQDLAIIQEEVDFEEDDITAKTTIDNLADFFQGDDDSEDSILEVSNDVESNNLEVSATRDFDEFNEFADFNRNDGTTSNSVLTPNSTTTNLETEQQLQTPELNSIDDDFDFDGLESMIGNPSGMHDSGHRVSDNQVTGSFNDQLAVNSDDMDFDELEALLGDSFDAETSKAQIPANSLASVAVAPAPVAKPVDDFDDLENLLQEKYSPDIGTLKTKTPTRQPVTTRKPKLTDSTMRVDVKYLDSLNNLVGELVVNRNLLEQDQERLQQFITNLLHQVQLLSDVSQRMRDQYDRSLLEASLSAGRGRSYTSSFETAYSSGDGGGANNSVTNDFEGIEFDRYNTFHVLSQEIIELIVRVRESASDIEFVVGETDQVTRQLGTITTQVQDDLKQSRMVPFAQIADRLPRGIRDRALKTGKQAELEIFGRETLIDKAILESLTDPLTHLVNNAIDHGLEDPATRQAAGKPATGKLTVRTYHQGNQTVISISDDGAGISTDKVKKSAVSKGVRSQAEVDRLNDTEVYALLFEPGFSTAAQADEFKGRGVGLDVVKTCLDDIRGVIIVESVVGKGTTFTIRLPLTLSISKAMFCISDRARIAFPVDGFEDMVEVPQNQIMLNEKGQPCLPWRDTLLPFQHLSNLLSYSRHLSRSSIYGKQENDELCIIILRNDTSYLALQVDQFLGEYEIVIKQLEGPIPQPAGIAGATVLGDGRVMAIANVLELFDIASGRLRPSTSGATIQPTIEEEVAADPTVLIVDDSITVRELLSLTFAKVGYRVEQAKDGQDAWEKLRAGLPCDMIFCDIEMPRMDGLDLLSRLQKDSRLKEIPVAMLTSRGADRHRQSAIQLGAKGYFTKPYLEEELLSASKRLLAGETLPI